MAEDSPALPGWVAERLDEIFAGFPTDLGIEPFREDYADGLARSGEAADPESARAACRAVLISELETLGVDHTVLDALTQVLEALEDELGEDR
jgi:hypothetical protein